MPRNRPKRQRVISSNLRSRPRSRLDARGNGAGTWFYQIPSNGLGNFIMATPALQLLAGKLGRPIPVYFATEALSTLYVDCSFVSVLGRKPSTPAFCTTAAPSRRSGESDSEAYCRILVGNRDPMPHTYVDRPTESLWAREPAKKYAAVFHGCLNKNAVAKGKDLGSKTRAGILAALKKRGVVPVLLGDGPDRRRFWQQLDRSGAIDYVGKLSLRDSIAALAACDFFVSNDTGLYHAAGALKIPGMVFWHKTDPVKNRSPFEGIQHVVDRANTTKVYLGALETYLDEI